MSRIVGKSVFYAVCRIPLAPNVPVLRVYVRAWVCVRSEDGDKGDSYVLELNCYVGEDVEDVTNDLSGSRKASLLLEELSSFCRSEGIEFLEGEVVWEE